MAAADHPIAVVGVACRVPGANNCRDLWKLLMESRDTVGAFPSERAADVDHVTATVRDRCDCKNPFFTGSFFDEVDAFDESLFGISAKEALYIEPEQRIFLETVYELLQDSGMAPRVRGSRTGVYVGHTVNKYKTILTDNHPSISHGNHPPFIASRVSYTFDLRGPALMVATGCSSSLLAVHLACQGLVGGDCDAAVAGGITLDLLPFNMKTDIWNQLGITGQGVRCRPFDAAANGIAKGEGCGVVMLKRLDDALGDGDHVYGVLLGSVANQDGRSNGITAPHPLAQADMLVRAWDRAGVRPDQLSYIEAHGTGTLLGDPIEMSGIRAAFLTSLGREQVSDTKIPIQSLKANIGHLADGAAGVMSLIKVLLCLHYETIPAAVHFDRPNPHIDWKRSPVYVNTQPLRWSENGHRWTRTAGVSSFGLLGTNVHVVVRATSDQSDRNRRQSAYQDAEGECRRILVLSAKTKKSLEGLVRSHVAFFEQDDIDRLYGSIDDVFYTVNVSRHHDTFNNRLVLAASSWQDVVRHLRCLDFDVPAPDDGIRAIGESGGATYRLDVGLSDGRSKTSVGSWYEQFLDGGNVDWNQVYSGEHRRRVPLLPTYSFDRKRFWPQTDKPSINSHLLALEHSTGCSPVTDDESVDCETEPWKSASDTRKDTGVELDIESVMKTALNDAMQRDIDWEKHRADNLFCLGMDSLMCIQVISYIQERIGKHLSFTMRELHDNPTFGQLAELLTGKSDASRIPHPAASAAAPPATEMLGARGMIGDRSYFVVSSAQQRLWVMQQVSMNKCAYNCCNGLTIRGPLERSALDAAVKRVTSRHAIFSTTFSSNVGSDDMDDDVRTLRQHINWDMKHTVIAVDLRTAGDPIQARGIAVDKFTADYKTEFDLEKGPLVRFLLYHISDDEFLFTMVVHHIIFDGSSHFIFWNQLWEEYSKVLADEAASGPEVVLPLYAEVAENEHQFLQTEKAKNDLGYWKAKLAPPLPVTTLPGDKSRPAVFTNRGRRITTFVDAEKIASLTELASNKHTTFTALLSTVFVLLNRFTGQTDMVVGFPVAARRRSDVRRVIGCFVNSVAIRLRLDGAETFLTLMDKTFKETVDVFDHQHVPFDWIVKELAVSRATDVSPIFNVSVTYHNTELLGEHVGPPSELDVERCLPHNDSAKWDLYFDFLEETSTGNFRFTIEYYSDLYSDDYARQVVRSYLELLGSLPSAAEEPLIKVPLNLMPNELAFRCGTRRPPIASSLPALLIEEAKANVDKVAVTHADSSRQRTYGQLLKSASEMAAFLREHLRLTTGSRIGLLVENSAETLSAILAVTSSGCCFVPLDANVPRSRLETMCNEASVRAILFTASNFQTAEQLRWACPLVESMLLIDREQFSDVKVADANPLMNMELWDYVANSGMDDIQAGGWKNSYNGEYFSHDEMTEYAANVKGKLERHLSADSVILEVGCGSGITTRQLCPLVRRYIATDASLAMSRRLEMKLGTQYEHLSVRCIEAAKISQEFSELRGQFDMIVLNSVVHCFPGQSYFVDVVSQCVELLASDGVLFIGDVMDQDREQNLVSSLVSYKRRNPGAKTKVDWSNEMFLSRSFLDDLCHSIPGLASIEISEKQGSIPNELTLFRYDVKFLKNHNITSDHNLGAIFNSLRCFAIQDVVNHAQRRNADDRTGTTEEAMENWSKRVLSSDDAYVLYTSGTTGVPKGIVIGHGALLNYVSNAVQLYGFDRQAVVPLFSPLTFDFTMTVVFCPLLKGAQIVVFPPFQESYRQIADRTDLTIAKLSPLQLQIMLSSDGPTVPLSETVFILGGEALTTRLLNLLWQRQGSTEFVVWNEYGPTEATVGCIVKRFSNEDFPLDPEMLISIGCPMDNCIAAVVDSEMQTVPVGADGRLCLGGAQLCSSFAGMRGTKTDQWRTSFTSTPSSSCQSFSEELFITDDIASVSPSGEFLYRGRCSTGITKINGVRVDLVEVRLALEWTCGVKQAWVCVIEDADGRSMIGAAVQMDSVPDEWNAILKSLSLQLPPIAVPRVLTSVREPPINVNGKVDMVQVARLLRAAYNNKCSVDDESGPSDQHLALSADPKESGICQEIQKVWQQVFSAGRPPKIDEDFFMDLGGDSLMAIHAVRRMSQRGLVISVADLFQFSTIRTLARMLSQHVLPVAEDGSSVIQCEAGMTFSPPPIVMDFFDMSPVHPDHYCLPALLRFTRSADLDLDTVDKALVKLLRKHVALRSSFISGERVTQVVRSVEDMFRPAQTMTVRQTRLEKQLELEPDFVEGCDRTEHSLSLSDGPVFSCVIVRYVEEMFALLVAHHLVVDVVSWNIILEDFAAAIDDTTQHRESTNPKTSFPDFCRKLHSSRCFGVQRQYWVDVARQCEGENCGKITTKPDAPHPATFSSARFLSVDLGAPTSQSSSEHSTLLAALGGALRAEHGRPCTAICLETHGRDLPECDVTETVGWCTCRCPFVVRSTVDEIESDLKALPNGGLGFRVLDQDAKLPRLMFVFLGSLGSKETTFGDGKYQFCYRPWIEVMVSELENGRFHRDAEERMEFDAEFIAWCYEDVLKIGVLFNDNVLEREVVERMLSSMQSYYGGSPEPQELSQMLPPEAALNTTGKCLNVKVISNVELTPDCVNAARRIAEQLSMKVSLNIPAPNEFYPQMFGTQPGDALIFVVCWSSDEECQEFINNFTQTRHIRSDSKTIIIDISKYTSQKSVNETLTALVEQHDNETVLRMSALSKIHFDAYSHERYNMPLTQSGYLLLGTFIGRAMTAALRPTPYKLIAVDGDDTIWDGECANGDVRVTTRAGLFQRFLKDKVRDGFLLALVSKNNEEDVRRVLDNNTQMILQTTDFVAIVANWTPKHVSLSSLSKKLSLGMDSFMFIDDNPAECSRVRAALPEVCVLQTPPTADLMRVFIDRLWMLDKLFPTHEDRRRTSQYLTEMRRKADLERTVDGPTDHRQINIEDVLRRWQMELTVVDLEVPSTELRSRPEIRVRIQELLQRTNQFKLNAIHTNLSELLESHHCWVVSLRDRFGCYGVISTVFYRVDGDTLLVDQWVLSCRALSRNVENTIMMLLRKEYQDRKLCHLAVHCQRTEKNIPAVEFLLSEGFQVPSGSRPAREKCTVTAAEHTSISWTVPTTKTSDVGLLVLSAHTTEPANNVAVTPDDIRMTSEVTEELQKQFDEWLSESWTPELKVQHDAMVVCPLMSLYPHVLNYGENGPEINPGTPSDVRTCLERLWMEVLNLKEIPHLVDDFFDFGGTSFHAVFLTTKIHRTLHLDVQLSDIFTNRTFGEFLRLLETRSVITDESPRPDAGCNPEESSTRPLSAAEQRMLLLHQFTPDSTAYVETVAIYRHCQQGQCTAEGFVREVFSKLSAAVLAFSGCLSRVEDEWVMCVTPGRGLEVSFAATDSLEDAAQLLARTKSEVNIEELVSFHYLSVVSKHVDVFAVHIHHLLADDVSLDCLAQILRDAIQEYPPGITHGPADYSEYVRFERQNYMTSGDYLRDAAFWEQTFSMETWPELPLPGGRQATYRVTDRLTAAYETRRLDAELVAVVREFCKRSKTTEFQFYMTCFFMVMQRYTASSSLVVGVPVTTRTDEFSETIGLFVNTLPFRVDVDLGQTFTELLHVVSSTWIQFFDRRHCPLDRVVRILRQQLGDSVHLPSVMFNYVGQTDATDRLFVPNNDAKMPLSLDVICRSTADGSVEAEVILEFASDMVDGQVASRFVDSFLVACRSAVKSDDKLIDIDVLSTEERKLLDEFETGGHDASISRQTSWTHPLRLFEQNVIYSPETISVICGRKKLRYAELHRMVERISASLSAVVEPEVLRSRPVFLVMDKDETAVAAVLAVWKAGGFFLPVSQTTIVKLKDLMDRASPAAVITNIDDQLTTIQKSHLTCPLLTMADCLASHISAGNVAEPGQAAYVMFTSGSTGDPKQCKISSNSLSCLAHAWRQEYALTSFPVSVLQWAPFCFDVFVGDLVKALVSSCGTLVVCPDDRRLDLDYVTDLVEAHQVSVMELTPQLATQLVDYPRFRDTAEVVRMFVLGSDVVKFHTFDKCKSVMTRARVVNSYGMTEATIDSSFFTGSPTDTLTGTVPIGKPLPGVVFHIVDRQTKLPVPLGTAGELCIGGLTIAEGDVTTLDLGSGRGRVLETGDGARWMNCGNVELLGRLDGTRKVRGFRVNTNEIEHKILSAVSFVRSAYVTVLSDIGGDQNLCAFVVPNDPKYLQNESRYVVRTELSKVLPSYSLPDFICPLETIPLTSNGKICHQKLPTLEQIRGRGNQESSSERRPELSNTANVLCQLVAESAGYSSSELVDIHRTFMEQGVHSLGLLRLADAIERKLNIKLSVSMLFSYPSVELLADHLHHPAALTGCASDSRIPSDDAAAADVDHDAVAIVGVGMRFPGGIASLSQLWETLDSGRNVFGKFPENRVANVLSCLPPFVRNKLLASGQFDGAFLDRIDLFDHEFFGLAPNEAKFMAPEQRLFLTVATEALLDADMLAGVSGSKVGVFVGTSEIGYSKLEKPDEAVCIAGELPSIIASRVAYHYDLKGPTAVVDTACSSSLVALHVACDAIRKGDCDAALVGGVSLVLFPSRSGVHGNHGILSPDFKCKSFDKDASGTAVGEGVTCLAVKPLRAALRDQNSIYAVVTGSASNSVGRGNGITAPSSVSQRSVIEAALRDAGCQPCHVSYVEGHGTGTRLGDGIELSALADVFTNSDCRIPIGSAKSSFGHLDAASGLLGVMKVLAQFVYRKLPPQLNFNHPHPELDGSKLRVVAEIEDWKPVPTAEKLIAGVSSFGLSGTNCHVVLEEPRRQEARGRHAAGGQLVLPFVTTQQLNSQASSLLQFIRTHDCQEISVELFAASVTKRCNELLKYIRHRRGKKSTNATWRFLATDVSECEQVTQRLKRIATVRTVDELLQEHSEEFRLVSEDVMMEMPCSNGHHLGLYLEVFSPRSHWLDFVQTKTLNHSALIDSEDEVHLSELLTSKMSTTRELVRQLQLARPKDLQKTLDDFCTSIIVTFFESTHLSSHWMKGKVLTFEDAFAHTGMHGHYRKLFFVMIRHLHECSIIRVKDADASSFEVVVSLCNAKVDSAAVLAKTAEEKYPAYADCFRFPLYCSEFYTKVLRGSMDPLSVIYPKGDLGFMHRFDRLGDLLGDVYYNMYMQLIAEYVRHLSRRPGRTIRVLEVGAGVGFVTRQLVPKLAGLDNVEYWFTDLGKAFVNNARTSFVENTPLMRFAVFDITKSAAEQGLEGDFDVIVSYNVIHTTESVRHSVANLHRTLCDTGTLFVIESSRNETWSTLAWGLLDGWWYFKDFDLRPHDPMLDPDTWLRVLDDEDFAAVSVCPVFDDERAHVEKFLYVCSNDARQRTIRIPDTRGWWEDEAQSAESKQIADVADDAHAVGDRSESDILESVIVIWKEVLGVSDVRADDGFNELGGESLLAIQMMTAVRRRLGYQLEIAHTFAYPTPRLLARFIYSEIQSDSTSADDSETATTSGTNDSNSASFQAVAELTVAEAGKTMIMFPGQGAQKRGMCKTLADSHGARRLFEQASRTIGYKLDIEGVSHDESDDWLSSTEKVQVILFVSSLAKIEQLQETEPELLRSVACVGGLSVGEIAALVFAGAIDFEPALRYVRTRGKAMEEEVQRQPSGMVSVFGPSTEQLNEYLTERFPSAEISTYLADNQHCVAGSESVCVEMVRQLMGEFKDQLGVIDARKLRVAGAFHSSYMKPACDRLSGDLDALTIRTPRIPIVMNYSGTMTTDAAIIRNELGKQTAAAVQWRESMVAAARAGMRNFIEVSPSRVLSSIVSNRIEFCRSCGCTQRWIPV